MQKTNKLKDKNMIWKVNGIIKTLSQKFRQYKVVQNDISWNFVLKQQRDNSQKNTKIAVWKIKE